MVEGDFGEERVVVRGILVRVVVANQNHLHFLHVVLLVHLECAPVHYIVQGRFRRTCVHFVLFQVVIHIVSEIVAFFEALMVSAD